MCNWNISTADMLTITSTVLGSMAIGFAIIGVAPVAGVLGVASAVIGLASTFFTYSPMLLEIPHENGGHIYIYIPASVSIA